MTIKEIFLTRENLSKIKEIDDSFYSNANLKIDWYLERYKPYHKAYILCDEKDNMVGYIVSVPIKKELYRTIIKGVLVNDLCINSSMFLEKSNYNYICSCVIKEEYRHKGYGVNLMQELINKTPRGKYCAITITKEGFNLAHKFMKMHTKINDSTYIFKLSIK